MARYDRLARRSARRVHRWDPTGLRPYPLLESSHDLVVAMLEETATALGGRTSQPSEESVADRQEQAAVVFCVSVLAVCASKGICYELDALDERLKRGMVRADGSLLDGMRAMGFRAGLKGPPLSMGRAWLSDIPELRSFFVWRAPLIQEPAP